MLQGSILIGNHIRPYDKAGTANRYTTFYYRFTTPLSTPEGGYYAAGRDSSHGWVFIDDACIPKGQQRFGGPKKS